eukprot:COSAG06_NODE_745_length_12649_cov_128.650916_4_plen_63_part_00
MQKMVNYYAIRRVIIALSMLECIFCCNVIAIRSDEFYILLASDGLWDVVRFPFKFLPPQLAV